MKWPTAFLPWHTQIAPALLTASLLILAGCSAGNGAGATAPGAGELEDSEVVAVLKTSKNAREFNKSLENKRRENAGIVVPAKEPAKAKKNLR